MQYTVDGTNYTCDDADTDKNNKIKLYIDFLSYGVVVIHFKHPKRGRPL